MSGPFSVPSLDEMRKKRKTKRAKGKEPKAAGVEVHMPLEVASAAVPTSTKQLAEITAASKKMKAPVEVEEDLENVIVKIPYGSTAISDPSSLSKFIKGLLLEEDEHRLTELGPSETSKKIAALSYQVMECGLFMQEFAETSQRNIRELEKSNIAVRKEVSELKTGLETSERKVRKVEKELKETQATLKMEREASESTIESYKESVDNLKKEKAQLIEQLEIIAFEAMMKERNNLMKEYLAGEDVAWKPKQWILEYNRLVVGLSLSNGSDEEEKGEEVYSKGAIGDKVIVGGDVVEKTAIKGHVEAAPEVQLVGVESISQPAAQSQEDIVTVDSPAEVPIESVEQ